MMKRFLAFVVYLSLSPLIAVAQDKTCSVYPDNQPTIVGKEHEITCSATPGTLIISWKLGLESRALSNTIIYHVDLSGSIESTPHSQADGFVVDYYSLRKSAITINSVTLGVAGYVYCCALDIITKEKFYCGSKLNVFEQRPIFVSHGINVKEGIFTNVTCGVTFKGSGNLIISILENTKSDSARNRSDVPFPSFDLHSYIQPYQHKISVTLNVSAVNRLSTDLKVQSGFYCEVHFDDSSSYSLLEHIEVDAPVTSAAIAPYSASKCSERRCRMHEKLVCLSDGKPQPKEFEWKLSLRHQKFYFLREFKQSHLLALDSGSSIYQCTVINRLDNYTFGADARFRTHVQAFEVQLDEYTTYESKGSKQKVWCPATIVAAVAGIIWIFMPHRAAEEVVSWSMDSSATSVD